MSERKYKYFTITEGSLKAAGKPVFAITNNRGAYSMGTISWYAGWKQYVFQPHAGTDWSADCLANIIAFLGEVNKETGK